MPLRLKLGRTAEENYFSGRDAALDHRSPVNTKELKVMKGFGAERRGNNAEWGRGLLSEENPTSRHV